MPLSSNYLSRSFSSTVEGGQSQNPCLLWITHHSIIQIELRYYVLKRESNCCISRRIRLISTPSRSSLLSWRPISKKTWSVYETNPDQGFHAFLRRCMYEVGAKQDSAEGHFRHSGISIEKIWLGVMFTIVVSTQHPSHLLTPCQFGFACTFGQSFSDILCLGEGPVSCRFSDISCYCYDDCVKEIIQTKRSPKLSTSSVS